MMPLGLSQPVTLTTRITHWFGRLLGVDAAPSVLPDPVTRPPTPIRSAADLQTESMKDAWNRLEAKRGARAFLSRADIDPAELKSVLPTIGLIEVHRAPLRFRVRLAGTSWRQMLNFEPTGLWLEEWPNPIQKQLLELTWTEAVNGSCAVHARRHAIVEGLALHYEVMTIPLAADGNTIDMLLIMSAPWHGAPRSAIERVPAD
jgi:hypothetical protein